MSQQTIRGNPKSDGEDCDNSGGYRQNNCIVFVNGITSTVKLEMLPGKPKVPVGFIILVVVYTGFK